MEVQLMRQAWRGAMQPAMAPADAPGGVSREAVLWALRFFTNREPVDEAEVKLHQQHTTLESLRIAFARTWEFEQFYAQALAIRPTFAAAPFLLRPPADPSVPWKFEQPTLDQPVSQMCTASQFAEPAFAEIAGAMFTPVRMHRKLWEHVYIVDVLALAGLIAPGRRGLGFGVGRERIPALLASRGVQVLATDAPEEGATDSEGWRKTDQFAGKALDLFFPEIVSLESFERLVSYSPLDMNAIPADLDGQFDFCWSSCSLEHLGSLAHGMDFIEASLRPLKPGGLAVHTTELNLTSATDTMETPGLSLYRRQDFEALAARLVAQGHEVAPLNFHPGYEEEDGLVDAPPYALPHLKLKLGAWTVTSMGMIVRKKM
jgi:hypothetical protein